MPRNLRRLLIQFPLGCMILFGVLIARVSHPSDREQALSFNPPACLMPCIFKLIPGETSYQDALAWVDENIPSQHHLGPQKFWIEDESGTQIFVTLRGYEGVRDLTKIELTTYDKGYIITLGQMLDAGYQPMRMYRGRRVGSTIAKFLIVFDGEQRILAVINADGYIADDTPIISLVMLSNTGRNIALADIQTGWGFDYEIFWQGYGSTRKYLNSPIQSLS
ncbi:MAG: hypothetical protein HY862_18120 [Chloroflexi bacterium]|nr:hypothetical protein [Chloroflexota bacterium]